MLREIRKEDAFLLKEITEVQLGYPVSVRFMESRIERLTQEPVHHVFAVWADPETDEVLGYIHAEKYESIYAQPMLNVLALAVSQPFTGQGIGKALLQHVENEAKHRGISTIRLNSGEARTEAHQFYEHLGYESSKNQKRFLKHLDQ